MPTKKANGKQYAINGKTFTWTTDEGGTVEIPMRLKLKVIRELADREMDASAMFDILERVIPGQADALDEMDVNDFSAMFQTWQTEYQKLSGAALGE